MDLRVGSILYILMVQFSTPVNNQLLPRFSSSDGNSITLIKEIIETNKVGSILFAIKGLNYHFQLLLADIGNRLLRDIDNKLVIMKTDNDGNDFIIPSQLSVFFVDSIQSLKYAT